MTVADLSQEFLIVGFDKSTDAAKFAEENGMSVKQSISKRVAIANLSEGFETHSSALPSPLFDDLPELPARPPVCNEQAAIYSAGDDRALLYTGLDRAEREAVMRWRTSHTGLKA
jgi:hypothetical protein